MEGGRKMSGSATPKELSPKRRRMMDMILAIGGMKEEQAIPLNKVNEAIGDLKKELSPLVDGIVSFPDSYFTKFLSTAKNAEIVAEIKDNGVLKDAISNLEKAIEISPTDALQNLLKSLTDTLTASEAAGKEKDVFTEKLQEVISKIETEPETALYLLQQNLAITTRYGQPPCHVECPAGVRTQRFVNLTRDRRFDEALQLMRDTYPFAGTLGRVCNAPCESRCQRGLIDQPVSIRNLHRFLADNERSSGKIKQPTPSINKDEKVAVIGAGPAGIGCAYDLARMGYPVTIFESKPKNGGLLRYGIPSYRLPRDILDEEISYVQQHGVEILNDQRITKPSELLTKGFSAVFVGTGASSSLKLRIEGEDAKGVFHALEFLDDINLGKSTELGKRVAVIGGGNAAIDSARVSLRTGASEVSIVYRRSKSEMPANEMEIEDAEHEGIDFKILSSPVKILETGGKVTGLRCIKMELGEPDASGRRRPVPVPDSEFDIEADSIVVAIGQGIEADDYFSDLEYTEWGLIQTDKQSLQTNVQGVFAGGDAVSGPATVVKAVGAGKKAAISIDRYIRGESVSQEISTPRIISATIDVDRAQATEERRAAMPMLEAEGRATTFDEVELGFDAKISATEASRCINCSISNMDITVYGGRIDPEAT
ncbi:MAG: hypothetical protein E4H14_16765, partial [Candidatus Thorarchaeota archaeon]